MQLKLRRGGHWCDRVPSAPGRAARGGVTGGGEKAAAV